MTNFKRYFRSHLKSNLLSLTIILALVLVSTVYIGITEQPSQYTDYSSPDRESYPYFKSTLYVPVTFMFVLAYVFTVMEFSFFKKRRNLDLVYSLPISKRVMGAVHYLAGLLEVLGIFTFSYIVNFIVLLSRGSQWFNFAPMIPHYFLCLLLGFSLYSLMVFVFNEANTVGDGIWFMAAYTFVYYVVMETISVLSGQGDDLVLLIVHGGIQFGVFDYMTRFFQSLVEIKPYNYYEIWIKLSFILEFSTLIVAGILSTLGLFFTFGKRRMEKTGEISNSVFGFRTFIPIYAVSAMLFWAMSEDTNYIVIWTSIEILAAIAYTIYRRGFRYKKSDIAVLCLLIIFLFV